MGGDEFVMITESSDRAEVLALAEKVLSKNGRKVAYPGGETEVSLYAGAIILGEHMKYSILCEDFEEVLGKARETGEIAFK